METELMKARDVALWLDISVRTVWRWTACGRLPSPFRLGRVTRWRRAEIDDYLTRCRVRLSPRTIV